jgi:hypothetical protein
VASLDAFHPGKEPRYPLDRKLDRSQSRSGRYGKEKNYLFLQGIKPRSSSLSLCGKRKAHAIVIKILPEIKKGLCRGHYATSRKVAGSILNEVIGFFS